MHTDVNLHNLMASLQQASDLDLLRLRAAIDYLLQSPKRLIAIRERLHLGQEVDFWNQRENRMQHGRVVQFKRDELLIQTENPSTYWWAEFAVIQFDACQAPQPAPPGRMQRSDFEPGDTVSFEGRDLIQRLGTIVRLNQKTATVSCDGQQWRVSYALLRRVVDI